MVAERAGEETTNGFSQNSTEDMLGERKGREAKVGFEAINNEKISKASNMTPAEISTMGLSTPLC